MTADPFAHFLVLVIIVVPMVVAWMVGHDATFIVAVGALAASMQAARFSMDAAKKGGPR